MTSYFELTELHIQPRAQGRGLGEALARRLLAGRSEANVLLSTPETNGEANRAWRLYRRLGFSDVIRGYHFAGDPRAFAILGRQLPLYTGASRSGTMTWCAPAVSRSRPGVSLRGRDAAAHGVGMLLLLVPCSPAACGSGHRITISPDDLVSGEIIAAAKPRNDKDTGPQLDTNWPFSQKVAVSNYDRDGYVGSQAVFSDLTFAELPELAQMNSDAQG